jgi:hypothetical protein
MSLARAMTSRMGETYVSFHTPEALEALCRRGGFEPIEMLSDRALEARFCTGRSDDLSVMQGFGIAHLRRMAG